MIFIVPFSKKYDRTVFDCGVESLNDWLKLQAGQQERKGNTRTFLAVDSESKEVLGYYASLATGIEVPRLAGNPRRGHTQPAIRMARLAVDVNTQGRGVGGLLLGHSLTGALDVADHVGVEIMVVDAIDARARDFYLRHGFNGLEDDPLTLVVRIKEIQILRKNV